jgi:hypothetical protein
VKRWLLFLAVGALALAVSGLVGVSKLEERDSFCAGCHRAPEMVYYERSLAAQTATDPVALADLAAFHYGDSAGFRCIDCHRGDDSVAHRGRVLLLAAGDTLIHLAGTADETVGKGAVTAVNPVLEAWQGPERYSRAPDILDAACFKCHQETLTLVGFENHFHNKLPAARRAYEATGQLYFPPNWTGPTGADALLATEASILTCLDCHRAHVEGFEVLFFLNENEVVLPACAQCHIEAGRGPRDLIQR